MSNVRCQMSNPYVKCQIVEKNPKSNPEPLKGFGNPASFSGAGLDAQYPSVVLD